MGIDKEGVVNRKAARRRRAAANAKRISRAQADQVKAPPGLESLEPRLYTSATNSTGITFARRATLGMYERAQSKFGEYQRWTNAPELFNDPPDVASSGGRGPASKAGRGSGRGSRQGGGRGRGRGRGGPGRRRARGNAKRTKQGLAPRIDEELSALEELAKAQSKARAEAAEAAKMAALGR